MDAGGGCSLWLDVDRRFIAQQSKLNLSRFLNLAKTGGSNGVVGWPSGTVLYNLFLSFFLEAKHMCMIMIEMTSFTR